MRNKRIRELRRAGMIHAEAIDGIRPEDVMGELLENSMGYYRWAREQVGEMKPGEFWLVDPRTKERIPCAEFELEQRLWHSVKDIALAMIKLNLDERSVVIEEAKMEMLYQAVLAAAEAANMDSEQRKRLGSELRTQLIELERKAA